MLHHPGIHTDQDRLRVRLRGLAAGGPRHGTSRQEGRRSSLAHHEPARAVRVRLDGDGRERVRFAEVVVGAPDPEGVAATLRALAER
jgi:hypothetical protein